MYRHRVALGLTCVPQEVRRARRVVGDRLARWGLAEGADSVLLVLSELVGNAVRHAPGGDVGVVVGASGREVLVEVRDGSARPPVLKEPVGAEDESGRGLVLVRVLAADWGWAAHADGGKTTWALVRVTAPVCGRRARLPAYLVPVALGLAPDGAAGAEDVERDLRCSLQAHATGEHHAHVTHLAGRDTGAVWARWIHPAGEVRLAVLPDCPAVGPPPSGEGCCEYDGHPGGHTYDLTGPRTEEI